MTRQKHSHFSDEIQHLSEICTENNRIDPALYGKYDVKRGLRDLDGKGVVTGLTEISTIISSKKENGADVPCEGELYYRGINIEDLVAGFENDDRFGFEETVYLLLFGTLPNKSELKDFEKLISAYRGLPRNFTRDVIMKAPSRDIMNCMARSILTLSSYDPNANDTSVQNVLNQCINLISDFPLLAVYSYQAYMHFGHGKSLIMHNPDPKLSTAENILRLLRPDSSYSHLEAKILDLALVLHAEHGGGNNSTFTNHVVTSSGTDTYSAMAASLCSLKGPKHGGANIMVKRMFDDIKKHVSDWKDREEISAYLEKILDKQAFDNSGLIYGMGHAVYSISDPRAEIFKRFVGVLASEKGYETEYRLYEKIERLAPLVISGKRKIYKGVSANIDFYSGFVYKMIDIPQEMFTPLFAVSRIAGWSAHRIEELINAGKIIRPAYHNVLPTREYTPLESRTEK